ncbi:MAG: ribonuclease P protein component [Phycisphaerales bacterium]
MPSLSFPKSRQLTHAREYQGVYGYRLRAVRGPMTLSIRPNELPHWRLGLAVSRRVGTAVARNRAKRLTREAFRMVQHDLPRRIVGTAGKDAVEDGGGGPSACGYDAVVSFHGTEALAGMTLEQCREWLEGLAEELHARSMKRRERGS